jgi:hypothetical protein
MLDVRSGSVDGAVGDAETGPQQPDLHRGRLPLDMPRIYLGPSEQRERADGGESAAAAASAPPGGSAAFALALDAVVCVEAHETTAADREQRPPPLGRRLGRFALRAPSGSSAVRARCRGVGSTAEMLVP